MPYQLPRNRVYSLDSLDSLRSPVALEPPPPLPRVAPPIDRPVAANVADELTVVLHDDVDALQHIAAHIAHPRFWTDDMLAAPLATFAYIFANPANFVVTLGRAPGDGALAYVRDSKPWRASFFGIAWGRGARRRPDLWRMATLAAFRAMEITALDGVTARSNTLAARAMERTGFSYRADLPGALLFNGERTDALWFELERSVVLDPAYLSTD